MGVMHSIVTKRNFILHGSYVCEKHSKILKFFNNYHGLYAFPVSKRKVGNITYSDKCCSVLNFHIITNTNLI